jgi:hypothetical protein
VSSLFCLYAYQKKHDQLGRKWFCKKQPDEALLLRLLCTFYLAAAFSLQLALDEELFID